MSAVGTMAAANASLKANKRLRKNKKSYSKFCKQIKPNTPTYRQITKEESKMKREAFLLKKDRDNRQRKKFQMFMITFYMSIVAYVLYALLI